MPYPPGAAPARAVGGPRPDAPARSLLYLLSPPDAEALARTLARIPEKAEEQLREIVVMAPPGGIELAASNGPRACRVTLHTGPRSYGYGGDRKAALDHALREGADRAVLMRADGTHPPEALPALLDASRGAAGPVFASRLAPGPGTTPAPGIAWTRGAAHAFAHALLNRTLGLRLRDYTTGFRAYPAKALRHVPFELNSDDRAFDIEILLQLRALGLAFVEVPVRPAWREDADRGEEARHVLRAFATALDYRLHQLHVTRRGRYLVDRGAHYTLKQSETGSHMQIVRAIEPGSRVLDLGCSQGLLATPLRERGATTVGVDAGGRGELRSELSAYYQRDLERPLELPLSRDFDYVVVADVIEHVRHAQQLLRNARRFLKPQGRLLISTPNIALWFYRLSLLVGRFEYGPRGVLDRTHVHLYTRATFRREVERAGFEVLKERYTALPFEVVFESTGRSRLVRAVSHAYHLLARLWPEMFAYQILLEARIRTLDEDATRAVGRPPR